MEKITFQDIYKPGHTVLENALFIHNHNPDMLLQYDSNFISFKRMPSVQEFEEAHQYLRDFHQKYGQKHVRFYFPDDEDFFELRNLNLRYNAEAILEKVTPADLSDRKAYRGLVTRELSDGQLEEIVQGIEGLIRKMATLPEEDESEKVYSLCLLLGERFAKSPKPRLPTPSAGQRAALFTAPEALRPLA